MQHTHPQREKHRISRSALLRASVLGANDGIVSIASLMLGVAAAHASTVAMLTAGVAGLVAGAMSMAAGEYVSVSSQLDSEKADLELEARELELFANEELQELTDIYIERGVEPELAIRVAVQIHDHDALGSHAREELGIDPEQLANPLQAAVGSAVSFAGGAALPLLAGLLFKGTIGLWAIVIASLLAMVLSGGIGAQVGGGSRAKAAIRVLLGGGLAMVITATIGALVGSTL